jgi:hypothetical protein
MALSVAVVPPEASVDAEAEAGAGVSDAARDG